MEIQGATQAGVPGTSLELCGQAALGGRNKAYVLRLIFTEWLFRATRCDRCDRSGETKRRSISQAVQSLVGEGGQEIPTQR